MTVPTKRKKAKDGTLVRSGHSRFGFRISVERLGSWRIAAKRRNMDLTAWLIEAGDIAAAKDIVDITVCPASAVHNLTKKDVENLGHLARAVKKHVEETAPKPVPQPVGPDEVEQEFVLPDLNAHCKHGRRHGEVCYKCDPKFGYPTIP